MRGFLRRQEIAKNANFHAWHVLLIQLHVHLVQMDIDFKATYASVMLGLLKLLQIAINAHFHVNNVHLIQLHALLACLALNFQETHASANFLVKHVLVLHMNVSLAWQALILPTINAFLLILHRNLRIKSILAMNLPTMTTILRNAWNAKSKIVKSV